MCYHTRFTENLSNLESRFKASLHKDSNRLFFEIPRFHINGFSHPDMLILPQEEPSALIPSIWGIVPTKVKETGLKEYYKQAVKFGGGLNAQSEKLFEHFIYKHSSLNRRCIIPVTGFYEPHHFNKKKYPYYVHNKNKVPMSLAGIYTVLDKIVTFSILTKSASPLLEKIHNTKKRQPMILSKELENAWLSDNLNENQIKEIINTRYQDDQLETYTVSKDIFNPSIDSNTMDIAKKQIYPELEDFRLF